MSLEECDRLAREPNTVVMSCELDLGIEDLKEEIWRQLDLLRLYTKRRGVQPKFDDPMVVRNNSTILEVCDSIHRDMKINSNMHWFGVQVLNIHHRNVD